MNTQLNQFNALIKRSGKSCILNNSTNIKGVFKEIDDKEKEIDTKYFYTTKDLKQGDMITYNNVTYIVITLNQNINNVYCIYVVRECPFVLKYWCGDTLKQTPIFVDTKVLDTTTTTYMQLLDGQVYITVQSNTSTNVIALNDRLIKFGYAWKITSIDRTVAGVLKLNCKVDVFITGDDTVNEIPQHTATTHTYVVSVNPSSISSLEVGSTQQLTANVTQDGNTLSNAIFTYISSDTTIATVNATGLVTGIKAGNSTITVTYTDTNNTAHTATVSCNIISKSATTKTLDIIQGNKALNVNKTGTYTIDYTDGTAPNGTWTISDISKASIVSQTNTSVILKGVSTGQTVLIYTDGDGVSVKKKTINVQIGW
ncbi:Ig-like domain-containing protein [Clostridium guangxiense]|uniref:Ig-like domain-containing protein n=1 Tax=Clostridium guangxiense TaxID=1662055 RepID=UPI001E5D9A4E|nr:Ig-like domain-containing protein [Clostridium guangxiense]MCD2346228.1 Ig-like domain-containing protein [Clostridium guangxiense]